MVLLTIVGNLEVHELVAVALQSFAVAAFVWLLQPQNATRRGQRTSAAVIGVALLLTSVAVLAYY